MEPPIEQFRDQVETIIEFTQSLYDKAYKGDRAVLGISVEALLFDLLEEWSTHNDTSQLWIKAESEDLGGVIFIHAQDEATNVDLQILINKDGIFLEMNIVCPEKLPTMPDDFWQQWLELNSFGKFELIENESFGDNDKKRHPELFPVEGSNIFAMMRNIIAFPLLYGEPIAWCNLSINWPFDQYSIREVFEKGSLAFERLWHLNKRLIAGK
ncbi:MAG: hypothetical protein ABI760_25315 [Ferruginibacter sp.]